MLRTTQLGFVIILAAGVSFIGAAVESNASVAPKQAAVQTDQLLRADLAAAQSSASKSAGDQNSKSADTASTKPAKLADDETFLHRASMDLIGQPPTPAEITSFVLDPSPDKRSKMVDKLLAKSEFGENWARYWRDVIMYRRSEDRSLLASPALTQYLTEQFNKNTPWDQIARSFITATGDVRENGATGIIAAQFGQAPEVTAEVSRIFMGIEIQCANCHNHPTDRWKRTQFHELAAFFPRLAMRPVNLATPGQRSFAVVGVDRPQKLQRPNPNLPQGEPEHYMPDLKNPSSKGTLMQPVFFLTGQKLPEGTPDAERRATIAKWITAKQDPWFAKAFVNRIWSELVGEGFYEPVDDMGPDRECTAPKTLDYLANQFVLHDYDVKWLYRTIMDTAAYQRDSRSRHLPGETPFVANCPQRLRADELFTALMSAIGVQDDPVAKQGGQGGAKRYQPRDMRGLFNAMFGYDPSVRRDEVVGSIPQALVLMNSPQLARAIDGKRTDTALGELLSNTKDDEAVTTELYLRCLAREPKPSEMKICLDHVKQTSSRPEAFENILWALVNSTEFLHRK
ncbi:MAG TPA: DUF1549 domain-containing protein [Pirellulales bacterium]|jgi:hypothetical protein|nr:DUF1549 domain-containing protein [Pirellulales bacterium]